MTARTVLTIGAGFIGLDSFVYFANDGTSDSKLAAVTIRCVAAS